MLAIELEFLTGRYVATDRGNRQSAEWPPHPARLFAAMVAAWGERGADSAEHAALTWVEGLGPPLLRLPPHFAHQTVTAFVPINDSNEQVNKKGKWYQPAAQGVVLGRDRQPRSFPSVSLSEEERTVLFIWPGADARQLLSHREALDRLLANVTYVGHSSSLVRAATHLGPAAATHCPTSPGDMEDELAGMKLRVVGPGRLAALEQAHHLSLAVGRRIEPSPGAFRNYTKAHPTVAEAASGVFERMIVFRRVSGAAIPLHATLKVTTLVRRALMTLSEQPPPEELSGHAVDHSPSQSPHIALAPLAFVGHRYADGGLRGFAVVLPKQIEGGARRKILAALGKLNQLKLGDAGDWRLERMGAEIPIDSLRPGPYIGPAREWATVTPIIFGRFPKKLYGEEAQRMVCEHSRHDRPAGPGARRDRRGISGAGRAAEHTLRHVEHQRQGNRRVVSQRPPPPADAAGRPPATVAGACNALVRPASEWAGHLGRWSLLGHGVLSPDGRLALRRRRR